MGRTALFDRAAVTELLAGQNGVITRHQARTCGITEAALHHRIRQDGPWQVLLPGVYLASTGTPTMSQRQMAALLYAGPGSAITGTAALTAHGVTVPDRPTVDVLIPAERQKRDHSFVHVLRTSRMPNVVYSAAGLRYVPPVRAVADAARQLTDITEVRAIVAAAIQWRNIPVVDLAAEIEQGPPRGSARFRAVLAEISDGVRSVAEADLRKLIKRYGLPDPMYNPRLCLGEEFVAIPDAWWPEAGLAAEVDSKQWHMSPRDWERTMTRHSRMSALGIIVLHYTPGRLRAEPRVIAAEIRSALDASWGRRLPAFRAVPAQ